MVMLLGSGCRSVAQGPVFEPSIRKEADEKEEEEEEEGGRKKEQQQQLQASQCYTMRHCL